MSKFTLHKKTKTHDYYFMDGIVREQFRIGGTIVYVYKYEGPEDTVVDKPDIPNFMGKSNENDIQDSLYLENRDRKYSADIYELKGAYIMSDNDFDLSQFAMFTTNDILYITFHINDMVAILGRRLMPNDVLELPHLRDYLPLEIQQDPIPKFFSVQDTNRGGEGFSQTWYPHIWRAKIAPITDSHEYRNILGDSDDPHSLKNKISIQHRLHDTTQKIVAAAEQEHDFGSSIFDLADPPNVAQDVLEEYAGGEKEHINKGTEFPTNPTQKQLFLRTDFSPQRLYRRNGNIWERLYSANVREDQYGDNIFSNSEFVNNTDTILVDGKEVKQRQSPSLSAINDDRNS